MYVRAYMYVCMHTYIPMIRVFWLKPSVSNFAIFADNNKNLPGHWWPRFNSFPNFMLFLFFRNVQSLFVYLYNCKKLHAV